jgi:endonuclease YncB( thermonuclease family)
MEGDMRNGIHWAVYCLLLVAGNAMGYPDKTYGNVSQVEVTSIYDGDTFRVNIPGWPPIIGERIPIRLINADTPELRGECEEEIRLAREAKKVTVAILRSAESVSLNNIKRDKYFRIDANVIVDGRDLGSYLIANGYARPYSGGKRKGWC